MANVENHSEEHFPQFRTNGLDYDESIPNWEDRFPPANFTIDINKPSPNNTNNTTTTPGDGVVSTYGEYITKLAANKMVEKFWEDIMENLKGILSLASSEVNSLAEGAEATAEKKALTQSNLVQSILDLTPGYAIYNKESIAFLLSQKDCAGIKFYFCINHKKRLSLVLAGVDEKGCDLGVPSSQFSVIDRLRPKPKQEEEVNQSEAISEPHASIVENNMSAPSRNAAPTKLDVKQSSALVEVGGPNTRTARAALTTLGDIIKPAFRIETDSYSVAFREFFKNELPGNKI